MSLKINNVFLKNNKVGYPFSNPKAQILKNLFFFNKITTFSINYLTNYTNKDNYINSISFFFYTIHYNEIKIFSEINIIQN
jgi:hypothetical protein